MSHSYIQIPPDSTGKKILVEERRLLTYDTLVGTFSIGDVVKGASSGAEGTITGIVTLGFTATKGQLYLEKSTGTWVDNESIQVSAVTIADVNISGIEGDTIDDLQIQANVLADASNPHNVSKINEDGEMAIAFGAKSPTVQQSGALSIIPELLTFTPVYDYDLDDRDLYNNRLTIRVDSGFGSFSLGERVYGNTSGATGFITETNSTHNFITIEDVNGSFTDDEKIHQTSNTDIFAIADQPPTVSVNDVTASVELKTNSSLPYVRASRSSNLYFPFARNETTTVVFSASQFPVDNAGIVRRFGVYDDDNGFYWEILNSNASGNSTFDSSAALNTSGSTVLYVVHRTNTTGSIVNYAIGVSDFNVNKLDGSDATGFSLNITRPNKFWIDLPGSGAGEASFGVYNENGRRIKAHVFNLTNNSTFSNNPSPTNRLPVKQELIAHTGGTPAGTSEFRSSKGHLGVHSFADSFQTLTHGTSTSDHETMDKTRGEVPLLSLRARTEISSKTNRMLGKLSDITSNLLESRVSRTFKDSDISTNQISMKNHNLKTGDSVFFKEGSATLTGLTDYEKYWVTAVDTDTLTLSTSYNNASNTTPVVVAITAGSANSHVLEEPSDTSLLLKIRKNASIADSTWAGHNLARSGTDFSSDGTGFRVHPLITVAAGGSGYVVGDTLELNSGIINVREAVLEVMEINAGAITKVRVLPKTGGHGTEPDGSTSANYGSYNGKITSAIGHKANGVGFSSTSGTTATFNVTVEWGHGFWWTEVYGPWQRSDFSKLSSLHPDSHFFLSASEKIQTNLTVTGEVRTDALKNSKVVVSSNWLEIV